MFSFFKIMFVALMITACSGDTPDGPGDDYYTPDVTTRGYQWILKEKPFVSALKVSLGPYAHVIKADYMGPFNATAAHFGTQSTPEEPEAWRVPWVGWLEFNGTSHGALVGGRLVAKNIGYQYGDEPSRGGNGFERLKTVSEAIKSVRRLDPRHLAIVNFSKAGIMDGLIDTYGAMDGDILSYDYYTYGDDAYPFLNTIRQYGLKYSMPYWRYIKSFCYRGKFCEISESNVRWQAWVGLTYGYTAHTWFVYNINNCNHAHDDIEAVLFEGECGNFNKTAMWYFVAGLNKKLIEVTKVTKMCVSLGVRSVGDRISGVASFMPMEFGIVRNVSADGQLLIGIFKEIYHPERKHVVVQNPNRTATGSLETVGGSIDCGAITEFNLKPGEGKLISCQ